MKAIISKLAVKAAVNNSHDEIMELVERARQSITGYDVAAKMVFHALATEPTINGTYKMYASEQQQRNEGEYGSGKVQVDVRWYDAFMVIGFNMVATHGHLELSDLVNIVTKWNEDENNCSVRLDGGTIKTMSRAVITAMLRDGWVLSAADKQLPFIGEDGKERIRNARVFNQSEQFTELYNETYEDMLERVPMKCAPLKFAPEPWRFEDGKVVGIHPKANLQFCKGQSVPSQKTLDAINKGMAMPYHVHPAMIKLAGFALSNQHVFKELDDKDADEWVGELRVWDAMRRLQANQNYYFPVTGDSRMREYERGGVISPQGGNHCKAAFMDAAAPELGKSGYHALLVAFANAIGIKGSVKARMKAAQKLVADGTMHKWAMMHPITFLQQFKNEDKYQAYVIMLEIVAALNHSSLNGTVETYRCGVILHQDGICNGMQHMGIITRDRTTCTAVNIMESSHDDELNDAYGLVAQNARSIAQYGRDIPKQSVMVGGYGASDSTMIKQLDKHLAKIKVRYTEQMGKDLIDSIERSLPAIKSVTTAVKMACEQILENGETEIVMYAKDGFKQVQQYKYAPTAILPLGSFATVKHTDEPDILNCAQMVTATPPNMIHMNDGCHVRSVKLAADWKIVTVHDSYGTAPAHYFKTNVLLAECLADNYTDYCPVANLYEDYGLSWAGFYSSDPVSLDEVRKAYNAFS